MGGGAAVGGAGAAGCGGRRNIMVNSPGSLLPGSVGASGLGGLGGSCAGAAVGGLYPCIIIVSSPGAFFDAPGKGAGVLVGLPMPAEPIPRVESPGLL